MSTPIEVLCKGFPCKYHKEIVVFLSFFLSFSFFFILLFFGGGLATKLWIAWKVQCTMDLLLQSCLTGSDVSFQPETITLV